MKTTGASLAFLVLIIGVVVSFASTRAYADCDPCKQECPGQVCPILCNPANQFCQDSQPTGTGDGQETGVGDGTGQNVKLINPLGPGMGLLEFLNKILDFVITIGTVVVILMMVYIGFLFVIARGEPGKLSEARNALLWTVIGALILLGSKVIAVGIAATVQALSTGN